MGDETNHLQRLLFSLMNLKEVNDEFNKLYTFASSNLNMSESELIPSESEILMFFDKIGTRFNYEGFPNLETKLRLCLSKFINTIKEENKFKILHFLMKSTGNPFSTEYIFNINSLLEEIERQNFYEQQKALKEKKYCLGYLQQEFEKLELSQNNSTSNNEDRFSSTEICQVKQKLDVPYINYKHPFEHFPRPIYAVKSEREEVINALREAHNAEKWLLNNVQHSWWNDNNTGFTFTRNYYNFGIEWGKTSVEKRRNKITYLNEYTIIRELLWQVISDGNSKIAKRRSSVIKKRISIPSLSQEIFASLVDDFMNVTEKYQCMSSFCKSAQANRTTTPTSILKYSSALENSCKHFVSALIKIEHEIVEHEDAYTLVSFLNRLRPQMNIIRFLYNLHVESISATWTTDIAWLTVTRLLSVLYASMNRTTCASFVTLTIELFVETFSAYVDIIDSWLTEGVLHDSKREFVIGRTISDESNNYGNSCYAIVPFEEALLAETIKPAELLINMAKKLIANVDVLHQVNNLTVLRQYINVKSYPYEKFKNQVKSYLRMFSDESYISETFDRQPDCDEPSENVNMITDRPANDKCEPFLSKAFDGLLVEVKQTNDDKCDDVCKVYQLVGFDNSKQVPIEIYTIRNLCSLIESRTNAVQNLFKCLIIRENCLFQHLHTLGSFLLMDCHSLYSEMYEIIISNEPQRCHLLLGYLLKCVRLNKLPYADCFYITTSSQVQKFISHEKSKYSSLSNSLKIVDSIIVQYEVTWPVSAVITQEVLLKYYSPLFRLIIKLSIAYSAIVQHRDINEISRNHAIVRQLYILRYWMLEFLYKIKSYLMSIVEEHFVINLTENRINISNKDTINEDYLTSLDAAFIKCFQNEQLQKCSEIVYTKLWDICGTLLNCFFRRTKLNEDVLNCLLNSYIDCLSDFLRMIDYALKCTKQYFSSFIKLRFEIKSIIEAHKQIPDYKFISTFADHTSASTSSSFLLHNSFS